MISEVIVTRQRRYVSTCNFESTPHHSLKPTTHSVTFVGPGQLSSSDLFGNTGVSPVSRVQVVSLLESENVTPTFGYSRRVIQGGLNKLILSREWVLVIKLRIWLKVDNHGCFLLLTLLFSFPYIDRYDPTKDEVVTDSVDWYFNPVRSQSGSLYCFTSNYLEPFETGDRIQNPQDLTVCQDVVSFRLRLFVYRIVEGKKGLVTKKCDRFGRIGKNP